MENIGIGAGLAALAFWGFVAVAVLAATWNTIRKREAQHETLRRMVESGRPIDKEVLEVLSLATVDKEYRPDLEFRVTGLWVLPVAAGLVVMAFILGIAVPEAFYPILGASGLLFCLGVGYLVAARLVAGWSHGRATEV